MPLKAPISISLAPLQGFTDRIYRSAHARHFAGVDRYFIPYIEFQNDGSIKRSHQRDAQKLDGVEQVPQVLCSSFDHLSRLSIYLKDLGYCEVNLNLGCPYPMVAKRKKGSGLLPFPEEIKMLLQEWFENPPLELSIKLRLGYENPYEIYPVMEVLNGFPLKEIILHPRIGKDLYKGHANIEAFEQVLVNSKYPLTYNGDIDSVEKFQELSKRFNPVDNWMIGRGILSNPFLSEEIKCIAKSSNLCVTQIFKDIHLQKAKSSLEKSESLDLGLFGDALSLVCHPPGQNKNLRLKAFLEDLWRAYEEQYGQPAQALNKMKQHWIYLSQGFDNPRKVFKLIKKANKAEVYKQNIRKILMDTGI